LIVKNTSQSLKASSPQAHSSMVNGAVRNGQNPAANGGLWGVKWDGDKVIGMALALGE
jgi:hypothetical protein